MRKLETKTIVVASHNAGKIREIAELIGPFGFSAKSAAELKKMGSGTGAKATPLGHVVVQTKLAVAAQTHCLGFVVRLMGCGLQVTLRRPSRALRLLLDALVL